MGLSGLDSLVPNEENSIEGRQRFSVFFYGCLILFLGTPLNLLGLTGPSDDIYFWMNVANLSVGVISFVAYCKRKVGLKTALSVVLVSTMLETLSENLACALSPSAYNLQLIVANQVVSAILVMLAVVAYMRFLPYILSLISVGMYTACVLITGSPSLRNFYILILLVFFIISVLGEKLIRTVRKLESDNRNLKQDEADVLEMLHMDKQQARAYVEFSKKEAPTSKDAERLLGLIGEQSRHNLIRTVTDYQTEEQTQLALVTKAFPELSPSECKICRLVLQGKKLGEICRLLGKTENNITAHRGHIRKKLELQPQDNLKEALEKRMQFS